MARPFRIMSAMRSLSLLAVLAILISPVAVAQDEHAHHHHRTISFDTPEPIAVAPTGVTRTFTLVAHQNPWDFDISPTPFQANLGDTVVLNMTSRDVRHGFLLERYQLSSTVVLDPGKTTTVTFVADRVGQSQF